VSTSLAAMNAPPLERRARWLLIAVHIPFIAFTTLQGGLGLAMIRPLGYDSVALPLAIIASALQLRHSLAAADGVRPRHWQWSLLAVIVIACLPLIVLRDRWVTLQWYVTASCAMLLPARFALPIIASSSVGIGVWYAVTVSRPNAGIGEMLWGFAYWEALQFLGGAGLYGATRLVRLMDQLRDARADLAELAIGRERLRISRDLHDLLGQSLSAVSLKGDLAIGLLERNDIPHAIAEIDGLTAIARSTLRDVLDIAHREPPIALASEIERMVELLASIGTETRVELMPGPLSPAIDELFAWALREGMTNVLRHSSATACSIATVRGQGAVRLEIINDGAMPVASGGSGLAGLATRAAELSGTVTGRACDDGRFQLTVEVPEGSP